MKRIFFVVALMLSIVVSFSQTTYKGSFVIKDLSDNSKLEFYTSAIEKSNFEKYRLQDQDVILKFKNGFALELSSVKSLKSKGLVINTDQYEKVKADDYQYPLFKISEEGIIVVMHHAKISKEQSKLNSIK